MSRMTWRRHWCLPRRDYSRRTSGLNIPSQQAPRRVWALQTRVSAPRFGRAAFSSPSKSPATSGVLRLAIPVLFAAAAIHAGEINPAKSQAPSFRLDVMPVFFRAGCNSGGCHGAAIGKDGFHLSLFGYDPSGDYYRLTQQIIGRRVDMAVPEQSLLLLKATGLVPHSG